MESPFWTRTKVCEEVKLIQFFWFFQRQIFYALNYLEIMHLVQVHRYYGKTSRSICTIKTALWLPVHCETIYFKWRGWHGLVLYSFYLTCYRSMLISFLCQDLILVVFRIFASYVNEINLISNYILHFLQYLP